MRINTATLNFKNELVSLINNSGIPICNVEMVMSDVISIVRHKLKKAIEAEQKEVKSDEQSA